MKKNEMNDLKTNKIADLKRILSNKRQELSRFIVEKKDNKSKKSLSQSVMKKDIARILTFIRQKEITE